MRSQQGDHTDKITLSVTARTRAHCVSAEASNRAVEAVKRIGLGTQDVIHAVDRLMVTDMNLSKARDWRRLPRTPPPSKTSRLWRRFRSCSWPSSPTRRWLRTMGIFVDLNKELDRLGAAPAAGGTFSKASFADILPGLKSFFGLGRKQLARYWSI